MINVQMTVLLVSLMILTEYAFLAVIIYAMYAQNPIVIYAKNAKLDIYLKVLVYLFVLEVIIVIMNLENASFVNSIVKNVLHQKIVSNAIL
jgi:hypothetical protein